MPYILTSIFTYVFDLFILTMFMNNILETRNPRIPRPVFYFAYILTEILIFVTERLTRSLDSHYSLIICVSVSFVTTFLISFLYQTKIYTRIFSAISFQILALFGEYTFTGIISILYPEIYRFSFKELYIIMNLGSKAVLLFFTLIISGLFGKTFRSATLSHNLLTFTTPLITIIIMFFTPLRNINQGMNRSFFTCLYLCLALLNIIDYILLNRDYRQNTELFRLKQSETLIQFQQEKYKQISSAYKSNRSLIHDAKKHYFIMRQFIEKKQYEKLDTYLDFFVSDMEKTYSDINTGNLVIDSFVTNYKNICTENKIKFITDLSVDFNRIPVNDYELCIILGNILDNAINACTYNTSEDNYIKLTITSNHNDIFYIHTENTYNRSSKDSKPINDSDFSEHGYGLNNVRNTVENNHGIMNVYSEDVFVVDIVIPVIDNAKRISPPA